MGLNINFDDLKDAINTIEGTESILSRAGDKCSDGITGLDSRLSGCVSGISSGDISDIRSSLVTISNNIYDNAVAVTQIEKNALDQWQFGIYTEGDSSFFQVTSEMQSSFQQRMDFINTYVTFLENELGIQEDEYNKLFGNGIPLGEYEQEFDYLSRIISALGIYKDLGLNDIELKANVNHAINVKDWSTVYSYCVDNDLFVSINKYWNNESWKDSGLADKIKFYAAYPDETIFLARLAENFQWVFDDQEFLKEAKLAQRQIESADLGYLKTYLQSNIDMGRINEMRDYISPLMEEEARRRNDIAVLSNSLYNINQIKGLLPYEEYRNSDDFSKYINLDYTNGYGTLDKSLLELLGQDEVSLYAYLYDRDKTLASGYLDALADTINRRKGMKQAVEFIELLNTNGADLGDFFITGADGFADGIYNFGSGIYNFFASDGIKSVHDYEAMYKNMILSGMTEIDGFQLEWNNIASEYDEVFPDWYKTILKTNYSTMSSIGNMIIPSVLSFIPVVGKPLSSALLGVSAAGNGFETMKQDGITGWQVYAYGLFSGASEAITERILGGIPGLSNLGESFIKNCASEGFEEFFQEWLDAGVKGVLLGEPIDLSETFNNSLVAGLQGMLVSGMMQGGNNLAFKIGDEIVYWSESDFNSLTEALTTMNATGLAKISDIALESITNPTVQSFIAKQCISSGLLGEYSFLSSLSYESAKILLNNVSYYKSININSLVDNCKALGIDMGRGVELLNYSKINNIGIEEIIDLYQQTNHNIWTTLDGKHEVTMSSAEQLNRYFLLKKYGMSDTEVLTQMLNEYAKDSVYSGWLTKDDIINHVKESYDRLPESDKANFSYEDYLKVKLQLMPCNPETQMPARYNEVKQQLEDSGSVTLFWSNQDLANCLGKYGNGIGRPATSTSASAAFTIPSNQIEIPSDFSTKTMEQQADWMGTNLGLDVKNYATGAFMIEIDESLYGDKWTASNPFTQGANQDYVPGMQTSGGKSEVIIPRIEDLIESIPSDIQDKMNRAIKKEDYTAAADMVYNGISSGKIKIKDGVKITRVY